MSGSSDPRDKALGLLLGLLSKPEQEVVLAYVGRHSLQHDDDMFVLLALLKIGALLVHQVADTVDGQQFAAGEMHEMLHRHRDALARLLASEREQLLDRWGDMMGVEQSIADALEGHRTALTAQVSAIRQLSKGLDQRIGTLRPLLDLLRAEPNSRFSPTDLVLDNISFATKEGIRSGLAAHLGGKWLRWLTCGRDVALTAAMVILLYRTWV